MHIETERKYVIEKPSLEMLSSCEDYTESKIEQIYLELGIKTHRIRKRVYIDKTVFTETEKLSRSSMSAYESEREISEEKYNDLKIHREKNTEILVKTRHTFVFGGLVFEIDIYEKLNNVAIMEVELESENIAPALPPFIKIIKEVTGDKRYSNAQMSLRFPKDLS